MTEQTLQAGPRIAYFVSEYPATSHTFILREVASAGSRLPPRASMRTRGRSPR